MGLPGALLIAIEVYRLRIDTNISTISIIRYSDAIARSNSIARLSSISYRSEDNNTSTKSYVLLSPTTIISNVTIT